MGENAPAWLASSGHLQKTLAPKSQIAFPLRGWIYAGALSLAATLLVVFLSIPKSDRQGIVAIPENVPNQGTIAEIEIGDFAIGHV